MLTERTGNIFDKLIFYGLHFLIVFTPFATVSTLPFSLSIPWSLAVTALVVLFLVAVWLIRDAYQGIFKFASTPLNLPIIAFITLILFQLLPLPPTILQLVSPSSVSIYKMIGNENMEEISKTLLPQQTPTEQNIQPANASLPVTPLSTADKKDTALKNNANAVEPPSGASHKEWHAITLYRYASKVELFRLLMYAGIYFLVVNNVHSKRQIKQLVTTIIITGASVAFLGLLQYLSGADKIFWLLDIKRTGFFSAFSNQDHFAGYMAMIIPLVTGLLITEYLQYQGTNSKREIRNPALKIANHRVFFYIFTIVIMLSSLFFARSSGGAFSMMISFLLLVGIMLCRRRLRRFSWVVIPILTITLGMLIWIGIHPVIEELSTAVDIENKSLTARVEFWKDTVSAIRDFSFLGAGLGTFPFVYPQYSTITFNTFVNHAHNEYLELLLETGFIGLFFIVWAIYRFIKDNVLYHILGTTKGINHAYPVKNNSNKNRSLNTKSSYFPGKRNDPFIIGITIGCAIGVISMCLHCIVDFNFHIPANAFLLSVLLGIGTVAVHMGGADDTHNSD